MIKYSYKKAKRTNLRQDWIKFKSLRNQATQIIRDAKQKLYDSTAAKLASNSLSWSTLKTFISPYKQKSIPPLEHNDTIYSSEHDKAFLSKPIRPRRSECTPTSYSSYQD